MPQQYSVVQLSFPEPGLFIPRREDLHSNVFSLPLTPPNFSITALSWWGKNTGEAVNQQLSAGRTQLPWHKYCTSWSDHPCMHFLPLESHCAPASLIFPVCFDCRPCEHGSLLPAHQCSTEGLNWEVSLPNHQQWKCFCSWNDLGSTLQGQCAQHKAVNSGGQEGNVMLGIQPLHFYYTISPRRNTKWWFKENKNPNPSTNKKRIKKPPTPPKPSPVLWKSGHTACKPSFLPQ